MAANGLRQLPPPRPPSPLLATLSAMEPPIGMIAGLGRLPELIVEGVHRAGRAVGCVGLRGTHDPALARHCEQYAVAGIAQLGRQIRLLRRWGVREMIMAGRVEKTRIYQPWLVIRNLPDLRAIRLWYRRLRHDRRTDFLLRAVAEEFARGGITMIDTTRYIPEHVADEGLMTRTAPSPARRADIDFALPIVARLGELDIGQAIAVRDCETIAVEAIEGTDAMIERAGGLCRVGGWVLVKAAKPQQDLSLDAPVVGVETIERMAASGGACLALEAGRVIMVDKPGVIAAAERHRIAILGVRLPPPA